MSLADVAPTILARVGIEPMAGLDGVDLLGSLGDASAGESYSESGSPLLPEAIASGMALDASIASRRRAIVSGRWKLVNVPRRGGRVYELYDLVADPEERNRLIRSRDASGLRRRLDGWIARDPQASDSAVVPWPRTRPSACARSVMSTKAGTLRSVALEADSLERLVPDELAPGDLTGGEALRISLERYEFAARHARAGRLLDVACGVGYGTRLVADRAAGVEALGIDLSPEAIGYAKRRYAGPRARFAVADAMAWSDPEGFDTIVSIETIEHLPAPAAFVARLVRMLRPGGVLVASVPTTPSIDANPHHLHDFSERSFRRLFTPHGLAERDALEQDQPFGLGALLARREPRLRGLRRGLPGWYAAHPGSLVRRIGSTLRHGFKNRYLTLALEARP